MNHACDCMMSHGIDLPVELCLLSNGTTHIKS